MMPGEIPMRRSFLIAAALAAAAAPQPAQALKPGPAPEMKLKVTQEPDPLRLGGEGLVRVLVEPPEGITLNRYPGIKLAIEKSTGLTPGASGAFVGTTTPIDDPNEFAFKKIEPLELKVTPTRSGTGEIEGTLTFTYCVKASGFCAPAKQKVKLPVRAAR